MAPRTWLAVAAAALLFCASAAAHGGRYDPIVLPRPVTWADGSGATVAEPGRPTTPRSPTPGAGAGAPVPAAGPTTRAPAPPVGGRPSPTSPATPRGIPVEADATAWDNWWALHRDRYLGRTDAARRGATTGSDDFFMGVGRTATARVSLRPTERELREIVVPTLERLLRTTTDREPLTTGMIAWAKVTASRDDIDPLPLLRRQLGHADQTVREIAGLAMGLTTRVEALDDLLDLAFDRPAGRALSGRSSVNARSRAFATYGVAFVARAHSDWRVKHRVFTDLRQLLMDTPGANSDLRVATIQALGLLAFDPIAHRGLAHAASLALREYFTMPLGPGHSVAQAHCAAAAARILAAQPADPSDSRGRWHGQESRAWQRLLIAELGGENDRGTAWCTQAAALALGELAGPVDDASDPGAAACDALARGATAARDAQTRAFCTMALGRMGGTRPRETLLQLLRDGNKATVKPWAALALGVLRAEACRRAAPNAPAPDPLVGAELLRTLRDTKNPSTRAACTIALGLARFEPAAAELRDVLSRNSHQDELAGSACIGLALMGDVAATPDVRTLLEEAGHRARLLPRTIIALGLLGDHALGVTLVAMLHEDAHDAARLSSLATATALIDDRRLLAPLVAIVDDTSRTPLARAYAAAALGCIADPAPEAWNLELCIGLNYRATVATLLDGAAGILDLL